MSNAVRRRNVCLCDDGVDSRIDVVCRLDIHEENELTERKFNLGLSMVACFVSVGAGALFVCIAIILFDAGPLASLEGIAFWATAQPAILFIALGSMPLGALLRMVLGLAFERPRFVALIAGGTIGLCGSVFFAIGTIDDVFAGVQIAIIGVVAGIFGGWTWWWVEKPFLDSK